MFDQSEPTHQETVTKRPTVTARPASEEIGFSVGACDGRALCGHASVELILFFTVNFGFSLLCSENLSDCSPKKTISKTRDPLLFIPRLC